MPQPTIVSIDQLISILKQSGNVAREFIPPERIPELKAIGDDVIDTIAERTKANRAEALFLHAGLLATFLEVIKDDPPMQMYNLTMN